MTDTRSSVTAYASLRFKGELLEPSRITDIVRVAPTTAYRKGEVYKKDGKGHEVRGRTGLCKFSSKGHVDSADLNDHLEYLAKIISSGDAKDRLRNLMRDGRIEADVSCFWPKSNWPEISDKFRRVFDGLDARIKIDRF